jgi:fibronectin type 3 domain-containing protein
MALAETTVRDFRATDQPIFGARRQRPASSAPVFRDIAAGIRQIRGLPGPGLSQREIAGLISERPRVKVFTNIIRPQTTPPPAPPPAPAELSHEAKQDLVMGSLLQKDVNKTLGLGFDDTNVTPGTTYQYALRELDRAGAQSAQDIASVSITVGADPQPAPPTGFEAAQVDADSVDLRWTRLSLEQEQPFGLASYNLVRVTPQTPAGVKINKLPIVIADIPGNNGQHVEPTSFYSDGGVPIGKATYKLTMVDMFGRESEPATLDFNMEDWFTPDAVPQVGAELRGNDVAVSWISHADAAIQYRIYRIDTEDASGKPVLITPQPVPGTPIAQPSPKQSSMMVSAALRLKAAQARSAQHRGLLDQLRPTMDKVMQAGPKPPMVSVTPRAPLWVSYTDPNVPKDHYFRYVVTAVYTRNLRDSVESPGSLVPVPSMEKLPAPASPKFAFAPTRSRALDDSLPGAAVRETNGSRSLDSPIGASAKLDVATLKPGAFQAAKPFVPGKPGAVATGVTVFKGIDPNVGGVVSLSWTSVPGKAPIKYKVYRANATGYFPTAPESSRESPAANIPRALGELSVKGLQKEALAPKTASAFAVPRKSAELRASAVTMKYIQKVAAPPTSYWNYLGETSSSSFNESITRSHANYYNYRIVPVSRWGVDGNGVEVQVRTPATLAPSVPTVLAAFPGDQGQVVLQIRSNVGEEEVTKYHIYRKKVDVPVNIAPVIPTGGAGSAPAQPPVAAPFSPQISTSVRLRGLGGAAPRMVQAAPRIGSRTLVADGALAKRIGTGSARFGIVAKESVFSSVAALIANPITKMDPAMAALLDLNSYEAVGTADGKAGDSTGLLVFEDKSVTAQQDYVYRVVAENSDSLRSGPSTLTDAKAYKVTADPPVNLVIVKEGAGVKLTWAAGPGGAVGYMVMRKSSSTSPAIQLGGIRKEASYTDFSVFPGASYVYQVIAVDSSSNVSAPLEIAYAP